jgi:hypothetical protein
MAILVEEAAMDEEREDPDTGYDREREDALREQLYIEQERAEQEAAELGIEVPYTGPRLWNGESDETEDVPF